ncbi:DinB family protein [Muricauda sp. 2012CJ35-5]|uniref:DinB family protein n=1 Tax=Flagellimonas spongiicola TaxID=2942208 RepID=A0ABT0PYD7_9FLAO|nr:DinB family protein [Allomuricauda spongiicola]MCL6275488.1 DinB family protein [Allomuricauda spongiicola]
MIQNTVKGLLLLLFYLTVSNINAQVKKENILVAWDNMTKMVVETAKAMPEENYSFKPTEELRDFAQQLAHTSGANYLFASVVKLETPDPNPITETKAKNKVIAELEGSFAFIRSGIAGLNQEDLNEEIEFFGSKMSRLQSILIMTDHLQREHGKSTIYTRLKGIAPGPSGGW